MQPTAGRGPSILDHLPPSTNTYVYESLDQFTSILSAETERLQQDRDNRSQFLVFAHVPNNAFEQDLHEWPTLALESGYTDSQGKLTANAEWWLSASNGDTKIAMTLDIDKKSRKITIKAFEYSDTSNLHEESVTVQKPYNSDTQVLGAPLRIPFIVTASRF
ncbi:hypothetical protein PHISP_01433 [Aspergillus sp. HF37]|nr:hypothetical protein PHISP_01433 [Aspergillus sp. HF37]